MLRVETTRTRARPPCQRQKLGRQKSVGLARARERESEKLNRTSRRHWRAGGRVLGAGAFRRWAPRRNSSRQFRGQKSSGRGAREAEWPSASQQQSGRPCRSQAFSTFNKQQKGFCQQKEKERKRTYICSPLFALAGSRVESSQVAHSTCGRPMRSCSRDYLVLANLQGDEDMMGDDK